MSCYSNSNHNDYNENNENKVVQDKYNSSANLWTNWCTMDNFIFNIGFLCGLVQSISTFNKSCHILNNPLIVIINSLFSGILYAICAFMTSKLIPKFIKFIIPLCLVVSTIYIVNNNVKNTDLNQSCELYENILSGSYTFYFLENNYDNIINPNKCIFKLIINNKFLGICTN